MKPTAVKFSKDTNDFFLTLRGRVSDYFKTNGISKFGNSRMVTKTVFMIALYVIPYILMISGVVANVWGVFAMWVLMGFGMSGIGLSIMHDANHGAYSKNKRVNKYLGFMMEVVGGSSLNWRIQHNKLHHSYTNIHGMDEDIMPPKFLRFSPHQKRTKVHRFQHIYAWFFYGLMTISWITAKDFKGLYRYKKMGLTQNQKKSFNRLFWDIVITKVLYYAYALVIPLLVLDISWWLVVIFFFIMHFVCGFVLGIIFQPAHVMPTSEYPLPDKKGNVLNNWAIHQMLTTTNFAPKSKIFSWFVGGLNYQIEHHLFPKICHVHYKKISKIVKETAKEYGLPYNSKSNFIKAIWDHGKMLRNLGRYDMV